MTEKEMRTDGAMVVLAALRHAGVKVDHDQASDMYTIHVPKGLPFPTTAGLPPFKVSGEAIEDLTWHLGGDGACAFIVNVKRPWDRDKILGYRREHGGPIHE